jgi:hypothetical protein
VGIDNNNNMEELIFLAGGLLEDHVSGIREHQIKQQSLS